jgi:hypothetical protein
MPITKPGTGQSSTNCARRLLHPLKKIKMLLRSGCHWWRDDGSGDVTTEELKNAVMVLSLHACAGYILP